MAVHSQFPGRSASVSGPARDAFVIVPDDANDLATMARALYVGAAGDLSIVTPSGNDVVFAGVPSGTILPVSAIRVLDEGTSAGAIVGLV